MLSYISDLFITTLSSPIKNKSTLRSLRYVIMQMSLHILIGIFDDRNIHSDTDDGWSESAYQFTLVDLTNIRLLK